MSTNYYRVPTSDEVNRRHQKLNLRMQELDVWNPGMIERGYRFIPDPEDDWTQLSPWDEFMSEMSIHVGKRSSGWQFLWNFHKNKYYSNKAELINFIKSGRIVNEYGEQVNVDEFLEMAFNWCPDGIIVDKEYFDNNERSRVWMSNPAEYYDNIIDGLRVSPSTEFS